MNITVAGVAATMGQTPFAKKHHDMWFYETCLIGFDASERSLPKAFKTEVCE